MKKRSLLTCECYFDDHGCAYVYLGNIRRSFRTISRSFVVNGQRVDVNVDLGQKGKIVGVEVLI